MMSREMTNKEAISNLNHIYGIVSPDIQRSLDLAIKALEEERPQGECKNCKQFKKSLCENSYWGWCSIRRVTQDGDLETQVPKDYYCSWFEKGGKE